MAICDVSESALGQAGSDYPKASRFRDFRRLYDRSADFDAVVVSTTEHTHAFATLPALQLGKHVYCEKPLTHSVWEARVIREAAARAKVATQMGIQIHAQENYRRVVELVRAGAIGPVTEAHIWVGRAWGRQSAEDARKYGDIVSVRERPEGSTPVPPGLDWDLWLGPAPARPFHEVYYPGPKWYRWWDFGNGTMSDLGSHWMDLPFWALDLKAPRRIEAAGPPPHLEIAPASMRVTYDYDARGDNARRQGDVVPGLGEAAPLARRGHPEVGQRRPLHRLEGDAPGRLRSDKLLPEDDFRDFKPPEPTIPRSLGHHEEWIHACKTGAPTTCNFEYAGLLTEANHLGNVAYRTGKALEWDTASMRQQTPPRPSLSSVASTGRAGFWPDRPVSTASASPSDRDRYVHRVPEGRVPGRKGRFQGRRGRLRGGRSAAAGGRFISGKNEANWFIDLRTDSASDFDGVGTFVSRCN